MPGLRDRYTKLREDALRYADLLGGKHTVSDPGYEMHERVSENLTRKLAQVVPPQIAPHLADFGGLANEALTGTMQKVLGKPFFSDAGFDWRDVAANRRGQERAVDEIKMRMATRPPSTVPGSSFMPLGVDDLARSLSTYLAGRRANR